HRLVSPALVEVRLCANERRATVDLVGRLAKLLLANVTEHLRLFAELLLPGRGVGECDQIARPLVEFGQSGPRVGAVDVTAGGQEAPFHTRLIVDLTVDVSSFTHALLSLR